MSRRRVPAHLKGPITVVYKQRKKTKDWICRILQFDLIGIGQTRQEAIVQAQGVLGSYIEEVLNSESPVEFFHPSDASDWNIKDRQDFLVTVELHSVAKEIPERPIDIHTLRRYYSGNVRGCNLVPA